MTNPVLVEITRGNMVESRHRGAYAVYRAGDGIIASAGDLDAVVYPRSAIKPLQAIAMLESGAVEKFGLDQRRVALSCASHNGEPEHVAEVRNWLLDLGLSEEDLCCAGHYAQRQEACIQQVKDGVALTPALNNCSGKHMGMLSTARALGEDVAGYDRPDHPVQQRVRHILSEMSGHDLSDAPMGIDGCGIPVLGMPLGAIARAMAGLAEPETGGEARKAATAAIRAAMAAHPFFVAGSGRFCTEVMEVTRDQSQMKVGAEGVYCAVVPEQKIGIALKIDDGAVRAAERLMAELLLETGGISADDAESLPHWFTPKIKNWKGLVVGEANAHLP